MRAASALTNRLKALEVTAFEDLGDVPASVEVLSDGTARLEAMFIRHLRQLQAGAPWFAGGFRALERQS